MLNAKKITNCLYEIRKYFFPKLFKKANVKKIKKVLFYEINKVKKINYDEINEIFHMITNLKDIFKEDIKMFLESDPAALSEDEVILCYPGFLAIFVYRISHILYLKRITLIPRIMTEYAHQITGIDIHPGAEIGERFFIDHGTGIVIGETSIIGNNVKIYQGVTIGALSLDKGKKLKNIKRHPTIKNNVTIYANATILGGNTVIGNNVIIGGNTFITRTIDDNTIIYYQNQDNSKKEVKYGI